MKILIFGDICPTYDYRPLFDATPEKLFNDILPLIENSDLTVCNFECPATNSQIPLAKTGPNLKAEIKDIKFLKDSGFDILSLANNHILDYGQTGALDTLKHIDAEELKFLGCDEDIKRARVPLVIENGDCKIGFMSFAEHEFNIATSTEAGANLFDPYASLHDIAECKQKCDYLVVLYHGGIEHYIYPTPLLQKKCRAMVDSGADVVLCQHSHCIGTEERYKNGHIVYGQGNSVFGYREKDKSWNEGLLVELEIEQGITVTYHLLKATEQGICLNHARERLYQFQEDSLRLSDCQFIKDSFSEFCRKRQALDFPLFYGKHKNYIRLNRILNGRLFRPSNKTVMITHNLMRCDSWNEVIQEILRGKHHV